VPEELMPHEIEGLAHLIRSAEALPPTAGDAEVARAFERWLATNRSYALPGERNAARGFTEFLTNPTSGGHCEYFATTLALLLRHEHIGCRVVNGYLASEWDASGHELIIRRKHAHAWVEAMLPGIGWATLDATPAAEGSSADRSGGSWWATLMQWIERCWNDVTGFDQKARNRTIAWLLALPARLWLLSSTYPVQAVLAVATLAFWLTVRRRRRMLPAGVRELRRAARAAGLKFRPGETPRELLLRAAPLELAADLRQRLADAASAHERLRYAPAEAP
jgi:transglutaminase-like putative cysteine protease